jgi:hypothetical protein
MRKRSTTSALVVATLAILASAAVIGSVATGRLSLPAPVQEFLDSWGANSASPSVVAMPRTRDAGVRGADAGPIARRQAAPLSSAQLGAPLVHGTFVTACGAPDDMKVVVKVAVKMGHAVSVTANTDPSNPTVAACIERATRELQWDISPHTDKVTVSY